MPITPRLTDPNAAAHERVYRTLRQQVMHGELPPGQALTLRGLGKQFGVSMTPAREAVRRLAAGGPRPDAPFIARRAHALAGDAVLAPCGADAQSEGKPPARRLGWL